MSKFAVRKLAFAMLLVLLAGPVDRAFASGTDSTSAPTADPTTPPTTPTNPVTGTDPEPTSPYIVSLILTVLSLA
ncbi:MAG: hypothetical protein ABR923_21530 [Terracidiphilus sp.]|jgi:hypothetical protein